MKNTILTGKWVNISNYCCCTLYVVRRIKTVKSYQVGFHRLQEKNFILIFAEQISYSSQPLLHTACFSGISLSHQSFSYCSQLVPTISVFTPFFHPKHLNISNSQINCLLNFIRFLVHYHNCLLIIITILFSLTFPSLTLTPTNYPNYSRRIRSASFLFANNHLWTYWSHRR